MQRTLLEDVLNCFQLTTLAIMISLIYASSPEILSQDAMACAKLKQLAKGMTRHATHEGFQWIRVLSSIQLFLDDRVVVAGFTWCVII